MVLNNIASLKATAGTTTDRLASVLGYTNIGDGGGGNFVWDTSSTAADNGGTVIQVTGVTTGRWIRQVEGAVNVKWFGAIGNGTADDSAAIEKCFTAADNVYIPKGDFVIQRKIQLSNKSLKVVSSPDGFLNRRFTSTDRMLDFIGCPILELNINVRKSLPSTILLNDNGTFNNIPQMRVEGICGEIFFFTNCGKITVTDCAISEVYGYAVFGFTNGFVVFNGCSIKGPAYVDSVINTWGSEYLEINNCLFENIALLPDTFTVRKNGVDTPQQGSTTAYGWQFGQALSILGNNAHVYGCTFKNISGLSIGSDHTNPTAPNLYPTYLVIEGNHFICDSDKLKGTNPPGYIWAENQQSLVVKNNKFTYIKRNTGDGDFKLCRFAVARKNMEAPYFEYSGNYFIRAASSTRDVGTIFIQEGHNETVASIKNNIHNCPNSDFLYIGTLSTTRPCRILNIEGNDVICKNFVTGFNEEAFNGSNYFKLPQEISIINNSNISADQQLFFINGEYGAVDLVLNIIGNVIGKATQIGFLNGTFKANILENIAPSTEIFYNDASTQSGRGSIAIKRNQLSAIRLLTGNNCFYDIENNVVSGLTTLKRLVESRVTANKFNGLYLEEDCVNTVFMDNEFVGIMEFTNMSECIIQQNTFKRPGAGIRAHTLTGSGYVGNSCFIDNTWISSSAGTFIQFATSTSFSGISFVTRNRLIPVSDTPITLNAANKASDTAGHFKNYENFLIGTP